MAVSVEYIVSSVRTLWAKDKSGYFTNSEINNWLNAAQLMLFEYYWEQKSRNSKEAVDALMPFYKTAQLNFVNSMSNIPDDLVHQDVMIYTWSQNTPEGIITEQIPVRYISISELSESYRNPLIRPSIVKKRIYWTYVNNKFNVYPSIKTAMLYYYRHPKKVMYATRTINTPNGVAQIYDPLQSLDYEWNESEQENILDIVTFFAGLPLRDNNIINFVRAKQKEALIN